MALQKAFNGKKKEKGNNGDIKEKPSPVKGIKRPYLRGTEKKGGN